MRALLSTIGSRGDVQPLVALALELKALGHEARLCAPPDFSPWIASLGIPATPIGPELRTMIAARSQAAPPPLSADQRRQLAEGSVAAQFATVAAAAEGCDVIVAATALQVAARSVAEAMRIPYVFAAYCPVVLPSPHHAPPPLPAIPGEPPASPAADHQELWDRDAARFQGLFGAALNTHRASWGLTPVADVRSHVFTDRPWLAADPTLAPWAGGEDPGVIQTGAWLLRDERPLSRELEAFLSAGAPPIYFGFGSMRAAPDVGGTMVDAARALGRRAIVSRGWAGVSVEPAPDCLAVDEVNQQALFTRVAAVVHHGGAGTTTVAALAGAPQVVVPQLYDQHYWAARIAELGAGVAHAPGTPTVDSLAHALERALEPGVRAHARALAPAVGRDGAGMAAERLVRDVGQVVAEIGP